MQGKKTTNQERGRKYGGTSSFVDAGDPSKAPRQDEDGAEFAGSTTQPETEYAQDSSKQGVSNRPATEEHAFPDSDVPGDDSPTSVETTPKQQGGNRGGV